MKIKSVSGITCYVKNLKKTTEFYKVLGFDIKVRETNHITAYSNWFWIDFLLQSKDERPAFSRGSDFTNKGVGVFLYLSVDNVDEFHKHLLAQGIKSMTKPDDQPWGNREFILRDPDGYKIVIFKRK